MSNPNAANVDGTVGKCGPEEEEEEGWPQAAAVMAVVETVGKEEN